MNKKIVIIVLISQIFSLNSYSKQDDLSSFVVVSKRDPHYFELSNGSPYIPNGFNLVGPPREEEFERLFKIMAENKINYCRVWLSHRDWNVEHEKCLQFDPDRAKTIDHFLSLARKNGIRVKMCRRVYPELMWSSPIFKNTGTIPRYPGLFWIA